MLPSEILERGWCQQIRARDKDGFQVDIESSDAVSFCLSGSIDLSFISGVISVTNRRQLLDAISNKTDEMGFMTYVHYNDATKRTQQEVVELVKNAEQSIGLHSE